MKTKKITAAVAAIIMVCALGIAAMAYDSSADPIISLSYITDIFKPQILREVDSRIDNAVSKLSATTTQPADNTPAPDTSVTTAPTGYVVIELTAGDAVYASDACDIMLRAGQAVCIAPDANQGIADYTDAVEIYNGQALTKNHMCLIPRGDGRGVRAVSESVFIMIRGDYVVVSH